MINNNEDNQVPEIVPNGRGNYEEGMWIKAASKLGIKIPDSIKNMLFINGFETESLIATIDDKTISDIELFAQTDLLEIINKDDYNKYYGIYAQKPTKFKFLVGHKKLILMLVDYFKTMIASVEASTITPSTKKKKTESETPHKNEVTSGSLSLGNRDENSSSLKEGTEEEKMKVFNTLKNWAKLRVDSANWQSFERSFDTISIEIQHLHEARTPYCIIYCFCGCVYRIPKAAKRSYLSPRWVYSNYQTHLSEKHLRDFGSDSSLGITNKQRKTIQKIHTRPIDSFFKKDPEKTINILQDVTISPAQHPPATSPAIFGDSSQEKSSGKIDVEDSLLQTQPFDMLSDGNQLYQYNINAPETSKSKWKNIKYSRSERSKRERESSITVNQTLITNYYSLVDDICNTLSPEATDTILEHIPETSSIHTYTSTNTTSTESRKEHLSSFLKKLLVNALDNANNKESKNTYDDFTKKISLYLFYTAGRLVYETLQANLKDSLPSVSTLYRFVGEKHSRLDEGCIDFNGLKNFLEKKNIPKVVWISEDGTRVNGKIEYDLVSNKVVGFVLPHRQGIVENNAFLATSATAMQRYFQTGTKAAYAYVIVAQPLIPGSPSYCMGLFGTHNKFTYKDIIARWRSFKEEAAKFGITILGYSADGDTRLLKAMRLLSGLGIFEKPLSGMASDIAETPGQSSTESECRPKYQWYHMDTNTTDCYFQEFIHILTKLRVRYLKSTNRLIIGNYEATPNHLINIIHNTSKDKHLLTMTDVKAEDKMNFGSAEKICSDGVLEILSQIPGTDGSRIYLKMMNYLLSAFLDDTNSKQISLCERIYRIWYVVFILRVWRSSIKQNKNLTLKENFISTNCYNCIELNAHTIIKVVPMFKFNSDQLKLKSDMMHFPNMSSQPCEKLFRAARSMTSTYSTIINFSIKDLLYRVSRLNTINDIIGEINADFIFPREVKKRRDRQYAMTQEEIVNVNVELVVERALNDAKVEAKKLGFDATEDDFNKLDLQLDLNRQSDDVSENNTKLDELDEETKIDDNIIYEMEPNINESEEKSAQNMTFDIGEEERLDLKDYSHKVRNPDENSGFVEVQLKDKTKIIKKSSYCWHLAENNGRVSTDRLKRFIVSSSQKSSSTSSTKPKPRTSCPRPRPSKRDLGKRRQVEASSSKRPCKRLQKKNSDSSSCSSVDNVGHGEKSDTEENCDIDSDLDSDPLACDVVEIDIQLNKYYAIAYDRQWFIGRITEYLVEENASEKRYKATFLKSNNQNQFFWPRKIDTDIVEKDYVFYGPLELIGEGPFNLKRHDLINIEKKYKTF